MIINILQIYESKGKKRIHYDGYLYDDGDAGEWMCTEYVGLDTTLDIAVACGIAKYEEIHAAFCGQYTDRLKEDLWSFLATYKKTRSADITEATPPGCYYITEEDWK